MADQRFYSNPSYEVGLGARAASLQGSVDTEAPPTTLTEPIVPVNKALPPDPNVVWWDGDDDAMNPKNWSQFRKWMTVSIVSAISFITQVYRHDSAWIQLMVLGLLHLQCSHQACLN